MPLDLDPIRKLVQDLTFDDACRIFSDEEGETDDTWDRETGRYTSPDPDHSTHYEGICNISANRQVPIEVVEAGEETVITNYWVAVPDLETQFKKDMQILIISSLRDPRLVGKVLVVDEVIYGTFTLNRRLRSTLRSEVS